MEENEANFHRGGGVAWIKRNKLFEKASYRSFVDMKKEKGWIRRKQIRFGFTLRLLSKKKKKKVSRKLTCRMGVLGGDTWTKKT